MTDDIIASLKSQATEEKRLSASRFFKLKEGEYAFGDEFMGVGLAQVRSIAKSVTKEATLADVDKLIHNKWHEVRLIGFILLCDMMKRALPGKKDAPWGNAEKRKEITDFYLRNAKEAYNWDFVDLSAPRILGEMLLHPVAEGEMPSREILDRLAASDNLWEQRISIVATLPLIQAGQLDDALRISTKLLPHRHDLIHKAVGWMLREVGKQDADTLRRYLDEHYKELPRTTLRYAIEKFPEEERKAWIDRKNH